MTVPLTVQTENEAPEAYLELCQISMKKMFSKNYLLNITTQKIILDVRLGSKYAPGQEDSQIFKKYQELFLHKH